jgi:putative ABC transport system permease protein
VIRHLFKLVWNRKRANALVVVEILVSFLVLFGVVLLATQYASIYWRPLGFERERVVAVSIDVGQESDDYWSPEAIEQTRQVLLATRGFDEVEAAAGAHTLPYSFGGSYGSSMIDGRRLEFDRNEVTDELPSVLGLDMVAGRWFGREDNGATPPVVVNRAFAEALYGSAAAAVGQPFREGDERGARIVGVVDEYRRGGELSLPINVLFERRTLESEDRPPRNLLLKVKPGAGAAFEARLLERLRAVAPGWSFRVDSLDAMRRQSLSVYLAPLALAALVTAFLLLMVALGLVGVLWQGVTRRRPEIGVRRAQGATARDIHLQIVGEVAVVTTLALAIGALVVLQLPILDLLGYVDKTVFFASLAAAAALCYALTAACAVYPSWLATRIQPAEALHYE